MNFVFEKSGEKSWTLVPLSGTLAGEVIGTVEGAVITGVRFDAGRIIGYLRSIWGLVISHDGVYTDAHTLRALCINKVIRPNADLPVLMTQDGFLDEITGRELRDANDVLLMGYAIHYR